MQQVNERIQRALNRLKRAGVKVRSFTVYPGRDEMRANITIEIGTIRKQTKGGPCKKR